MESKLACRTCLADTGELFELFGDTGMELGLPMKINEHLRIPVSFIIGHCFESCPWPVL